MSNPYDPSDPAGAAQTTSPPPDPHTQDPNPQPSDTMDAQQPDGVEAPTQPGPDPSNTPIEDLLAPLEPGDDAVARLDAMDITNPEGPQA